MKVLIKQPAEILHEPMTFGGVTTISALQSVTAVARGLVAGAAALVVVPVLFAGGLTLTVSGGSDGERYLVTTVVDDADGERRESEIDVAVIDASWAMPDGGAPMLSIAEFVQRFGLDEVVRMTDHQVAGRVGTEILVSALTDAQAIAEAHIAARYALPLDSVPVLIKGLIADIARARLYAGAAPEGVAGAAKAATRTLESIQAGKLAVAGAAAPSAAASEAPVLFHSAGRSYPDGLKDY